jgi:hypothetical protein
MADEEDEDVEPEEDEAKVASTGGDENKSQAPEAEPVSPSSPVYSDDAEEGDREDAGEIEHRLMLARRQAHAHRSARSRMQRMPRMSLDFN